MVSGFQVLSLTRIAISIVLGAKERRRIKPHTGSIMRSRLDRSDSAFEQAWLSLSKDLRSEYPSSAAFVRHCWRERVHLVLCEADGPTADDIERYHLRAGRQVDNVVHLFAWRYRSLGSGRPVSVMADREAERCLTSLQQTPASTIVRWRGWCPHVISR